MSVTGDFSAAQRLLGALDQLGSPGFREDIFRQQAEVALRLVREEFAGGFGPDGTPWAPTKRPGGHPLFVTGRFRDSFSTSSGIRGFRIESSAPFAEAHQFGASLRGGGRLPARPILPEGLDGRWGAAMDEVVEGAMEALFGD